MNLPKKQDPEYFQGLALNLFPNANKRLVFKTSLSSVVCCVGLYKTCVFLPFISVRITHNNSGVNHSTIIHD